MGQLQTQAGPCGSGHLFLSEGRGDGEGVQTICGTSGPWTPWWKNTAGQKHCARLGNGIKSPQNGLNRFLALSHAAQLAAIRTSRLSWSLL